jgi:hypothetical protein
LNCGVLPVGPASADGSPCGFGAVAGGVCRAQPEPFAGAVVVPGGEDTFLNGLGFCRT